MVGAVDDEGGLVAPRSSVIAKARIKNTLQRAADIVANQRIKVVTPLQA